VDFRERCNGDLVLLQVDGRLGCQNVRNARANVALKSERPNFDVRFMSAFHPIATNPAMAIP
ncbi:MAG TPA: hypothetical protein VMF32_05210, partial [Xanthobacteraceae bacterium]|nr:hypothetical protein [Xanthobacteraceae bacterium]